MLYTNGGQIKTNVIIIMTIKHLEKYDSSPKHCCCILKKFFLLFWKILRISKTIVPKTTWDSLKLES